MTENVTESCAQLATADESLSEPMDESLSQPADESLSEPADESSSEPADESLSQPADESLSQPMDESSSAHAVHAKPEPVQQRYRVQFTATQEYVDLLEEAKDLLAHAVPSRSLDELHLRAMRALVSELRKRKYAVTENVRTRAPKAARAAERVDPRGDARAVDCLDVGVSDLLQPETSTPADRRDDGTTATCQRGRYVPAAVRRAVWTRDGERCTYVDARGQRCRETSGLELHHDAPYALGGPPTESNLCVRCRAHNDLAAEHDFGRNFMACKKGVTLPHDIFQERPP
jgi:hypothetical protein